MAFLYNFKQILSIEFINYLTHKHKRVDRLLIGTAHLPGFGWVVMSPAST